jgi:hypothetical protein
VPWPTSIACTPGVLIPVFVTQNAGHIADDIPWLWFITVFQNLNLMNGLTSTTERFLKSNMLLKYNVPQLHHVPVCRHRERNKVPYVKDFANMASIQRFLTNR